MASGSALPCWPGQPGSRSGWATETEAETGLPWQLGGLSERPRWATEHGRSGEAWQRPGRQQRWPEQERRPWPWHRRRQGSSTRRTRKPSSRSRRTWPVHAWRPICTPGTSRWAWRRRRPCCRGGHREPCCRGGRRGPRNHLPCCAGLGSALEHEHDLAVRSVRGHVDRLRVDGHKRLQRSRRPPATLAHAASG